MTVPVLQELTALAEEDEFHTAAIMTYTLGLRFFEELVLPRLQRLGVGRIGIAADVYGYHQSFGDPLGADGCGRVYLAAPMRIARGIQHAKVLWLQGVHRQVAFVGSHNLTAAGFNDQLECTLRLDSEIPGHVTALRELQANLIRVLPPSLEMVSRELVPPPETEANPTAHFFSSLDRPLLEQLQEHVGTCDGVRIISPYLDPVAIEMVVSMLGATTIRVDIPEEGADIPLAYALSRVTGATAHRAHPRPGEPHRFVHAKSYALQRDSTHWLALGSANCTQAALLNAVDTGGNLEFWFCSMASKYQMTALSTTLSETSSRSQVLGVRGSWMPPWSRRSASTSLHGEMGCSA